MNMNNRSKKKMPKKKEEKNEGIVVRVQGPVVDVYFSGELPGIYEKVLIEMPDKKELALEVQFETGDGEVKCLAFESTDGISRGMKVKRTFSPISVPVGEKTLGRIFNVLGHPIDGKRFMGCPARKFTRERRNRRRLA